MRFYFDCGLPRSGSTLLIALLNQNPEIYAGTLSPVFELMYYTNEILHKEQAKAFPKPKIFQEIVTNTLINYYSDVKNQVVIDAASTLSGVSTSVGIVTTTSEALGLAVTTTTTTDTTSFTYTDVTTSSVTSTSETTTDGVTTRTDTVTTTETTNYETSYDYAAEATRLWDIYTALNS